MRRAGQGPALLTAMVVAGCYSYQPTPIAQVAPGTAVRVRLAPEEAARVGEVLGWESRYVEGQLLAPPSDSQVLIRVASRTQQHPAMTGVVFQQIAVPVRAIQDTEARRLDGRRTSLAVGAGAVALAGIVTGALAAQKQPEPGEPKGGTDALRGLPP